MSKSKALDEFGKEIMYGTGQKLQEYRKRKHCTQKQVSELLGITDETLSNYENGKVAIPFDTILMLCMIYGVGKLRFSPRINNCTIDIGFDVEPAGLKDIEYELTHSNETTCKIYQYINTLVEHEHDEIGKSMLQLYLSYCKTLKDKNGQKVVDDFTLYIEEKQRPKPKVPTVEELLDGLPPPTETVEKPQTHADYIGGLSVDVRT